MRRRSILLVGPQVWQEEITKVIGPGYPQEYGEQVEIFGATEVVEAQRLLRRGRNFYIAVVHAGAQARIDFATLLVPHLTMLDGTLDRIICCNVRGFHSELSPGLTVADSHVELAELVRDTLVDAVEAAGERAAIQ